MADNVVKVRSESFDASKAPISRPFFSVLLLVALVLAVYIGYGFISGKTILSNAADTGGGRVNRTVPAGQP